MAAWARAADVVPRPEALLDAVLSRPELSYSGHLTVTHRFGGGSRVEEAEVFFSPPNRYRWEFLAADGGVERVVVGDGAVEQVRIPGRRKVFRGEAIKGAGKLLSPERELELLGRNYRLAFAGAESVAGRPCWILELSPKEDGKPFQRLWIDREARVVLQNKRYRPRTGFAVLSSYNRFEPVMEEWPDSSFTLPEASSTAGEEHGLGPAFLTLDELNQVLGPSSAVPSELPGGFLFESADFFETGKETVRHLHYTDGLAALSLFITDRPVRMPGGRGASFGTGRPSQGPLRLSIAGSWLHFKRGRQHYTLMSDVSAELLDDISAGLKRP